MPVLESYEALEHEGKGDDKVELLTSPCEIGQHRYEKDENKHKDVIVKHLLDHRLVNSTIELVLFNSLHFLVQLTGFNLPTSGHHGYQRATRL